MYFNSCLLINTYTERLFKEIILLDNLNYVVKIAEVYIVYIFGGNGAGEKMKMWQ